MSKRFGPTPRQLLVAASDLLASPPPTLAGRWPRAIALMTRQAIEGALFDLWREVSPGVEAAPMRAQLLVLRHELNRRIVSDAEYAWSALSRACHQHPYELVPTAGELAGWLEAVHVLDHEIRRRLAARTPNESLAPPSASVAD